MKRFIRTYSIGAKIFGAFLAMGVIIGALGINSYYILSSTGSIAIDTYDKPMMAINFARAASLDFSQMQNEALRRRLVPASERAAVDKRIDELTSTFFDDLAVAEERTTQADEHQVIKEIEMLVGAWDDTHKRGFDTSDDADFQKLTSRIIDRFDVLVELKAGSSFVERRKALWTIYNFEYASIGVTALALLLALSLTVFLARSIVRPLQAAARVADRIAGGDMQTEIPKGGKDETGILLNSMQVMQGSIRAMMADEKAQRRSAETRLYDALESAQEGMMLVGPDGRVVVSNSRLIDFFPQISHALSSGSLFEIVFGLMQMQIVPVEGTVFPALGDAQSLVNFESWMTECRLHDGRWLRLEASKTSDGGLILFFADFSDIKAREEGFKQAKHEAEVASAAKSAFLANMSHELRTPLNAIIGFSEMIAGQFFGPVGNPRYAEYAGDILSGGRRLLDVINDVLEIARSEQGRIDSDMEALDLGDVLADAADRLAAQCKAAGLTFTVDGNWPALPVSGDARKLSQIFNNLFSNAAKFTPAGGAVSLTVSVDPARAIRVMLTDTGIGMNVDDIKVALTPFGQVDARLERKYEGTGLGLPLAAAHMKLHKADMMIDSVEGEGTTITLTFPMRTDVIGQEKNRPQEKSRNII
ncbi:MAG: ATP-binding protein [Parvibaculaceae bacterium]